MHRSLPKALRMSFFFFVCWPRLGGRLMSLPPFAGCAFNDITLLIPLVDPTKVGDIDLFCHV